MASAWPSGPSRRPAPARRRRRAPSSAAAGVAARPASRSALYQWYTDSAWWLVLTPAASPAPLAQQHRPLAGGDGVVEPVDQVALLGQQLEQLGLVRLGRRARRCRAPSRRTRPPGCARPTGPRRGRPSVAWRSIARRRRRRRPRGGSARPGRRPATTRGRRACRRCSATSPPGGSVPRSPGGTGRGGRRRRAARAGSARPGRAARSGGQPDAEAGEQVVGDRLRRARQQVEQVPGVGVEVAGAGQDRRRAPCAGARRRRGRASRPRRTGCRR